MEEMRQRLGQDGYLFVKGLIPREDVLDEREK
jgi:phytanoyl-CoA hydroxylase